MVIRQLVKYVHRRPVTQLQISQHTIKGAGLDFLDCNQEVAYQIYRCERPQVLFALLRDGYHDRITYNLMVKVMNHSQQKLFVQIPLQLMLQRYIKLKRRRHVEKI